MKWSGTKKSDEMWWNVMKYKKWWNSKVMKCDEILKSDEMWWNENVMKCDEMKNVMKWSGAK